MNQEALHTFRRRQRLWLPWRNIDTLTAPPYAALAIPIDFTLGGSDNLNEYTERYHIEVIDGEAVWRLKRPSALAIMLDPCFCFCNGPTPVPPQGFGECTQDWPAQVLADYPTNNGEAGEFHNFGPGSFCDFGAGGWAVRKLTYTGMRDRIADNDNKAYGEFLCLSFDPAIGTLPAFEGDSAVPAPQYNVIWVAPLSGSSFPHLHDADQVAEAGSAALADYALYAEIAGALGSPP